MASRSHPTPPPFEGHLYTKSCRTVTLWERLQKFPAPENFFLNYTAYLCFVIPVLLALLTNIKVQKIFPNIRYKIHKKWFFFKFHVQVNGAKNLTRTWTALSSVLVPSDFGPQHSSYGALSEAAKTQGTSVSLMIWAIES